MINFGCPACGELMSVPDSLIGDTQACPRCGACAKVPRPLDVAAQFPREKVADREDGTNFGTEGVRLCPACGTRMNRVIMTTRRRSVEKTRSQDFWKLCWKLVPIIVLSMICPPLLILILLVMLVKRSIQKSGEPAQPWLVWKSQYTTEEKRAWECPACGVRWDTE